MTEALDRLDARLHRSLRRAIYRYWRWLPHGIGADMIRPSTLLPFRPGDLAEFSRRIGAGLRLSNGAFVDLGQAAAATGYSLRQLARELELAQVVEDAR